MQIVDMSGWPPLDESARREVLESIDALAGEAARQGRDAAAVIEAAASFGRAFERYHGAAFAARVTRWDAAGGAVVRLIEPPAGCSLCLIEAGDSVVMIDSGFRCYRDELLGVIREELPDFEKRCRVMLLTHADIDHCGLIELADEVWMSKKCAEAFGEERRGGPNLREREPVQAAYERMIKRLSGYRTPPAEKLRAIGGTEARCEEPLRLIGCVGLDGLSFEAWEGRGGHVAGECVFVERTQRIAFTGDVYCNLKAYSPEQAAFNALAPRLMGSVDADRAAANAERRAIFGMLGESAWRIFGGHGGMREWP